MTPGVPPNGAKRGRRGTKKRSSTASRTKKCTKTSTRPTWTRQGGDFPTFPPPPGGHLGTPKRPKTKPKTIQNRSEKSRGKNNDPRRSWARLGAILGRLGCHLGALEALQTLRLPMFRENSLFRTWIDSKTVLGPTLADQGAKMSENDPQDGAQIDPKTIKHRHQNRYKKRCENQEGCT